MLNTLKQQDRAERLIVPPGPDIRTCHVSLAEARDATAWDAYVYAHKDGTVFHATGWRDAVENSFGHRPYYLIARRDRDIVGVFPLFLVKSFLAGRMLVSVPYAVGGGILADDRRAVGALFDHARAIAERENCRSIDLRSRKAMVSDLPVIDRYVGFERALPDRAEDVLAWLPRKARAAARNGRDKFGLSISFGPEHLHDVWSLYTHSMKRLASLAYPESFLRELLGAFDGKSWVCLVRKEGRPVAGLVTFLFRDRVMPYFIGTSDDAKRCSAANFIYFSLMERAVREGFGVFDFGRSREGNVGSYNFKRFNGFEPKPLEYQTFIPAGKTAPDLSPTNPTFGLARSVWRFLPLSVTRVVGGYVSKHVPG
jgi:FemAB-related protein (PEP-CTERM system-associated)